MYFGKRPCGTAFFSCSSPTPLVSGLAAQCPLGVPTPTGPDFEGSQISVPGWQPLEQGIGN